MTQRPELVLPMDPRQLNLEFYRRYDSAFLFNKVAALTYILDNKDRLRDDIARQDNLDGGADDDYFAALEAEIHFTEMHQFEALFMLLLAEFQPDAHWVYLTQYRPGEPSQKAQQFVDGDIHALTAGTLTSRHDLIRRVVYGDARPNDAEVARRWDENIDTVVWFVDRLARRYLKWLRGYNSYKHGLRVMTEQQTVSLGLEGGAESVIMEGRALSFLEIENDGHGRRLVSMVTGFFDPKVSYRCIVIMYKVLRTIQQRRIAGLTGQTTVNYAVQFLDVHRDAIPDPDATGWLRITRRPDDRRRMTE